MATETVPTTLANLLAFRRTKNTELFAKSLEVGNKAVVYTKATEGLILSAEVSANDPIFQSILSHCNKPMQFDSLMMSTHDFGNSSTWGETSLYQLIPYEGYKLVITSIVARFPAAINLNVNNLEFRVFKSYDGVNPVTDQHQPIVNDVYMNVTDLVKISNSTVSILPDPINQFTGDMYEIKFRYADSDMSNVSKLTLSSLLDERIEVGMQYDVPLVDINGTTITDPCYLFFNTKRVVDF